MDKYQSAIAEYENWRQEIVQLTSAIGDAASHSGGCSASCSNIDGDETCIARQWENNKEARYVEECTGERTEAEQVDLCCSCKEVQRLVYKRKLAKKYFGIAKRRISQIARPLIESHS